MTRRAVLLALALQARAEDFAVARPGYRYQFPRDHFAHPDFRTEWWYYTGNLNPVDGPRFGFELTFFRQAAARTPRSDSPWDVRDLYLAHLALSDIGGQQFWHFERVNRAGPGLAGADIGQRRIWNGNWEVRWQSDTQSLQAVTDRFTLRLEMVPLKPPVIHGRDGVSQKAPGEGRASHYVSFTRLRASGALEMEGKQQSLAGAAWMDHEFFTHQLEPEQVGWDWMSIQLDNGTELMVFRLRRKDGSLDPYSSGTWVDARGTVLPLEAKDFSMTPEAFWKSPDTQANYPVRWKIRVPRLSLDLEAATPLDRQELVGKSRWSPTYWEGAMDYAGSLGGKAIRGTGYLEMTGYDKPVQLGLGEGR